MKLDARQMDRALGALLGGAAGDALGVPYEAGLRRLDGEAQMLGGGIGRLAPGQWSDDTDMAIAIARVAATGADLRTEEALGRIADGFVEWFRDDPRDVGIQTRLVLSAVAGSDGQAVALMRRAAAQLHEETGRTAGNGSLMRTAPVALAHLGDPEAIVEAARAVSELTHCDPVAGDACALWCLAIDHAVRTGQVDVRVGLPHVDPSWADLLDEAEAHEPRHFSTTNGWVVAALQGAWSAITRASDLEDGLQRAVAGGGDTDTVAAIAGALLGARYGGSAVPARWRRRLHGWPGMRARDLSALVVLTANGGRPDGEGWPAAATIPSYAHAATVTTPHPDDAGVLLGAVGALQLGVADAVVSLCRLGKEQVPLAGVAPEDHVEFWLVDQEDANNDAPHVIADAARTVRDLRDEGKTVLVHCVHAQTRTPVVAAAYGALVTGGSTDEALQRVRRVLPSAQPRPSLVTALREAEPLLTGPNAGNGVASWEQ